jgi:hypothetical protein
MNRRSAESPAAAQDDRAVSLPHACRLVFIQGQALAAAACQSSSPAIRSPQRLHFFCLLQGFNAFGNNPDLQPLGNKHHGFDDGDVSFISRLNKGLVDLDGVNGQFADTENDE